MASVEPAVRTPGEGVERFVRVLVAEAIEQNLRRGRGLGRVGIEVGRDEQKVRRRADVYAAKAHFQPAHQIQSFVKDGALGEMAISFFIFKNDDAVFALAFWRALRVGVSLGHPQPPARVDGKRDWLHDVRFAGDKLRAKPFGEGHRLCCFFRRDPRKLELILRRQGMNQFFGRFPFIIQLRLGIVKNEVVEIDMSPPRLSDYPPAE